MNKKRFMTRHEHEEIGYNLQGIRDYLLLCTTTLSNNYGVASNVAKNSTQALKAVDRLRCDLDSKLFHEHHEKATPDIYYRKAKKRPSLIISQKVFK